MNKLNVNWIMNNVFDQKWHTDHDLKIIFKNFDVKKGFVKQFQSKRLRWVKFLLLKGQFLHKNPATLRLGNFAYKKQQDINMFVGGIQLDPVSYTVFLHEGVEKDYKRLLERKESLSYTDAVLNAIKVEHIECLERNKDAFNYLEDFTKDNITIFETKINQATLNLSKNTTRYRQFIKIYSMAMVSQLYNGNPSNDLLASMPNETFNYLMRVYYKNHLCKDCITLDTLKNNQINILPKGEQLICEYLAESFVQKIEEAVGCPSVLTSIIIAYA